MKQRPCKSPPNPLYTPHGGYRGLTLIRALPTTEKISLGDGRVVEAVGVGLKMLLKVSNSKKAMMYDALHVPKLACNLFSVRAAVKKREHSQVWSVKMLDQRTPSWNGLPRRKVVSFQP